MATSTELLRVAEHMRKRANDIAAAHITPFARDAAAFEIRKMADELEREAACIRVVEAKRLQTVEATSRLGGAAYMSDLRDDERQAVVDNMGSGFAPGSPRGWRDGRVAFSHLIDPTTRAPRCAGYMYHGDSVAIDCKPTCPGCLQWRSQNRSWPEGWPPFAVLRRAFYAMGVSHKPSTASVERHARGPSEADFARRKAAKGRRHAWARAVKIEMLETITISDPSTP